MMMMMCHASTTRRDIPDQDNMSMSMSATSSLASTTFTSAAVRDDRTMDMDVDTDIDTDRTRNRNLTYMFRTPRGKTAVVTVPASAPYDFFLQSLLQKAAKLDHYCESQSESSERECEVEVERRSDQHHHMDMDMNMNMNMKMNLSELAYVTHHGKVLDRQKYAKLTQSSRTTSHTHTHKHTHTPISLHLHLRVRGGIDRQNRVGSKFGGGGVSSSQQTERERKERLRELALETVDLAKDPYLMRNHLGSYECKLCLTLHTNEGNYLAHTQGKKHQSNLAKRAMMEKKLNKNASASASAEVGPALPSAAMAHRQKELMNRVKIGRPGYEITKSRHYQTHQRCLSFSLHYPEIDRGIQPRHRFMSAYEQRVESPPDRRYQYLLFAAEPYETIAFKVPNETIDRKEGMFVTNWDEEGKRFTLTLYFVNNQHDEKTK